jgi:N-acetylglucosaminyldiphosphoundecaprenol N-acetyl-beta-D-mannosaminyltransferase
MGGVIECCRAAMAERRQLLIGVVNAAKVVKLQSDEMLRESLLACDLLVADGQSIVWASRILGQPLPERVAGIDIFQRLLELGEAEGRSIYLLGAKPQVLALLEQHIRQRYPNVRIAGSRDGYYREEESAAVAKHIRSSGADMLFLGMSSPKKEIFLGTYGSSLGVPILHGVGGSFDVLAGITRRAPLSWQRLGMEWAYRLLQEPGRMWKRYLTTNAAFLVMTAREFAHPSPPFRRDAETGASPRLSQGRQS